MKVLLIGGAGFVGLHMQKYLATDFECFATDHIIDIRDLVALEKVVQHVRPDWVVHLAAVSHVQVSFETPFETYQVNFFGTLNVLVALRNAGFQGRMLYVGSSQVYGRQDAGIKALTESSILKPLNPYAVSKLAAEALCFQWSQTEDFEIVMVRPFNHIGPGQNENFVIPDFARQISEIKTGSRPAILEVGNIESARDFTDVKDVVRAYRLLLELGKNGEVYNVCSEKDTTIRQVIELLLELADVEAEIRHGAERYRVADQVKMVGSAEKIRAATGWTPQIPLRESLRLILEYYSQVVA